MGVEIERKYLVNGASFKDIAKQVEAISQGYLSRERERVVRVRTMGKRGFITVKGSTQGMSRLEFEYEIPYEEALKLFELCVPPIIKKDRYFVEYDGRQWEVDCFHGEKEGLVIAEIELPSEDTQFLLPPFIGKEVTGDPQYYNSNL